MDWLNSFLKMQTGLRGCGFFYSNGMWWFPPVLSKWVTVSTLNEKQKKELRLIEIPNNMVLLDFDDISYEDIKEKFKLLKKLDINHITYETNRGYHSHIFVKDLKSYSLNQIKQIRLNIIKYFDSDKCKASGGMMAIPFRSHFKTGKIVNLIKNINDGLNNSLPKQFYLFSKKKEYVRKKDWNKNVGCPLFEYCCNNKLKENTGRGLTLYRNMSAYLVNNYTLEEARAKFLKLCKTQESMQLHWIDYQMERKEQLYCGEIRNWLRDTQYLDVEQLTCWRCKNGK